VCVAHGPVYILVTLSLERIEFQKFPNLPQNTYKASESRLTSGFPFTTLV
jgi:hypothetical protein